RGSRRPPEGRQPHDQHVGKKKQQHHRQPSFGCHGTTLRSKTSLTLAALMSMSTLNMRKQSAANPTMHRAAVRRRVKSGSARGVIAASGGAWATDNSLTAPPRPA